MTKKQMFKKKSPNAETDESQAAISPQQAEDAEKVERSDRKFSVKKAKNPASVSKADAVVDFGNDTTRLSCDLPRRLHTSLRVAAAFSERSILGLIEALIVKHLLDQPCDQIIAEYHKSNDTE